MIDRELCRECSGNGVLKIKGGVSQCDRCNGDCWEPAASSDSWQPIETADADTQALLWTPRERLTDLPEHIAPEVRAEMRVSAPRYWTWATHWMPLPAPPTTSGEPSARFPRTADTGGNRRKS
jgi:hypothetical protein